MYFNPLPSQERLKELFNYNEETGDLIWKVKPSKRTKAGDIAGSKEEYIKIRIEGKAYRAHRLIWRYMTGEDPGELEIDHKDENKYNNAFINLRKATNGQQQGNRSVRKDNKVRLKGVCKVRNKYRAQIRCNGKHMHLGYYPTKEEAHKAYCEAADKLHGDFKNYG